MTNRSLVVISRFLFLLIVISFCNPLYAAKKKKKAADEVVSSEAASGETIKLPSPNKKTYFYKVDAEILAGVENGSPESLRAAMSALRNNKGDYLEKFAQVFRREGKNCPVCGTKIIKIKVAGRGTHVCPHCQEEPQK